MIPEMRPSMAEHDGLISGIGDVAIIDQYIRTRVLGFIRMIQGALSIKMVYCKAPREDMAIWKECTTG